MVYIMFMFTVFLISGKIVVILAMSGEVATTASKESDATMIEQTCAVSNNSMSMVELELRCFLSCDDVQMWNYSLTSQWPFVTRANCTTSDRLYQCTDGCVQSQTHGFSSQLYMVLGGSTYCAETLCHMNCMDALMCDGLTPLCHPWFSEECSITCYSSSNHPDHPCLKGCKLKDEQEKLNQSRAPPAPVGPPLLIPVQTESGRVLAGQFTVDLSGAVPQLENCESANENDITMVSAVAFLFKFEDVDSHNVSFNWTENPFAQMNLTGYACRQLQVSFAVGNAAKLSEFSPMALIKLSYETMNFTINQSATLTNISEKIDTRKGFFGHVILTISWLGPQDVAYLDDFVITVAPRSEVNVIDNICGCNIWSRRLSYDQDTIVVKADANGFLPIMGCQYNIQMFAVGSYGTSQPVKIIHDTNTTFDPKSIILFECKRRWEALGFSFDLNWTLPCYVGNAINQFVVELKLTDGTENVSIPIDNHTFILQDNEFEEESLEPVIISRLFNSSNHSITESFHFFEMYMIWNGDIAYRPPRHQYNCTESTMAPRPYPIENLKVTSCSENDSAISLSLEWSPPSIVNGRLDFYDVCIGNEPLEPDEEASNTSYNCLKQSKEMTSDTIIIQDQSEYPIHIQIRAHNLYAHGNWSEPSVIKEPIVQMCGASSTMIMTDSDNISAGLLGGFILLALLVSCIIITTIVLYVFWYVRNKYGLVIPTQEPIDPIFSSRPNTLQLERRTLHVASLPQPDNWEIPSKEIIMEDLLGEGAFGEVYKGVIKCPIINPKVQPSMKSSICTPVAVKLLKLSAQGNERKDFLSEIEMMKKVAEGQNAHVVGLLGCVTIQEPLCLITEFVKYGDLLSYLRSNRKKESFTESNTYLELGNISSDDLISFAYQIASGMEYLSSLGIIHRDLACRNILVGTGKVLKITDFGMSRETYQIYVQKRTGRVPLKWMAIESIIASEFTSASDVWSYGIVLWEICTLGGVPYPSIQNEDLLSHLKRGERMDKPDNCSSSEVYDIMLMCWNEQPQKRPTFIELRSRFDAMLLASKGNEYIDLHIDQSKLHNQQLNPDHKNAERMSLKSATGGLDHQYLNLKPERKQNNAAHEMIRSVSVNLSLDHCNTYVDQPSRMQVATSLTLTLPDRWEMDGKAT